MGLTADVVANAPILSTWGNQIRDRTAQVFASAAERAAQWTSPPSGAISVRDDGTATAGLEMYLAGQWREPWSLPWGLMGRAEKSTYQTSIGAGQTDISGLGVTFTAVVNRLYVVRAALSVVTGSSPSFPTITIRDGSNNVRATTYVAGPTIPTGGTTLPVHFGAQLIAAAGAFTVKVSAGFTVNSNNQAGGVSANEPAYILVEDVGPIGVPT